MKEPVIVYTNVRDKVRLEDKFEYIADITIGLADAGDFYLAIEFADLRMEDFKTLAELSKVPRRLSIKSDLIDKEGYNITHIVVTKFTASSNHSMTWECLSDDPALYNDLIN